MAWKCPDRQILSVYLDGELPSPWKEKLEAHLSACTECSGRLEGYRAAAVSAASDADDAAVSGAKERVWRALSARMAPRRRLPLWRRRVSLPMPALAAAAALALFLLAAAFFRMALPFRLRPADDALAGAVLHDALSAETADPSGAFFRRLNSDTVTLNPVLMLRLPESTHFRARGKPVFVKGGARQHGQ
jgi:anti-sigma factor RsiW